jgi:hypothetical protein
MHSRRTLAYALSLTLHALTLAAIAGLFHVGTVARSPAPVVAVMAVAPAAAAPQDEPVAPPRHEERGVHGNPRLEVGGFTFDIDRIARRRHELFPFITGDVAFERMTNALASAADAPLANPFAPTRARRAPSLTLDSAAIQQIVDDSWSRRDRWKRFAEIRGLLDEYDADTGAVPVVLRSYLARNILQPYWDASIPDPRVWVMLGLSADHVDFIDFIATYVHAHPSTKAATELLFLLDKLVQGSRDSLLALLALDPETEAAFTRRANPEAFDLLVSIRQRYRQALAARGLLTATDIGRRYDAVRLTLLRSIIDVTPDGYLANDARYLAGSIQWRAGHPDAALEWWRAIRPTPEDVYHDATQRLAALLNARDARGNPHVDRRAITALLRAEDGRWLMMSYDRLRHFGYRFETY